MRLVICQPHTRFFVTPFLADQRARIQQLIDGEGSDQTRVERLVNDYNADLAELRTMPPLDVPLAISPIHFQARPMA